MRPRAQSVAIRDARPAAAHPGDLGRLVSKAQPKAAKRPVTIRDNFERERMLALPSLPRQTATTLPAGRSLAVDARRTGNQRPRRAERALPCKRSRRNVRWRSAASGSQRNTVSFPWSVSDEAPVVAEASP